MIAVTAMAPGGPDVLVATQRAVPEAGPGEVLVRVAAAGINRPDLMQREGHYPPPAGVTDVLGLEVAGIVDAIGPPGADGHAPRSAAGRVWQRGDRVMALVAGGGYAEYCAAPGVQCLPIPSGLTLVEAAAIPETYFTVWTNVFERGRLVSGETLLVHGGTSGIGTTAIQLARARGARVIATAGSEEKCRRVAQLGADAINYRTTDFGAAVKTLTATRGVDVILDIVGGDTTARNLACLARDGRLVQIGMMGGATATISLQTIMLRRLTLTGSTLRARTPAEKGAIALALEREVWPLLASRAVAPIIDRVVPFPDAAEAHRRLESGETIGKVVLEVGAAPRN